MFKINKKSLVGVSVLSLLVFFLSGIVPSFRPVATNIFKYPLLLLSVVGRELNGFIFFHRNLMENQRLKGRIDELSGQLNKAKEILLENQRLTRLLSLQQDLPYKVVAARVIGRDAGNWSSLIILNKGASSAIKKGFVCVSPSGLVGRVVEISSSTSKVMLINDPNLGVSAMCQRSRQEGLVSGSLGGFLLMKYLPKDCDIQKSDTIITSGLSGNYPKGVVIGKVVEIGNEFSGLSHYAVVRPAANLSGIEEVLIIIK